MATQWVLLLALVSTASAKVEALRTAASDVTPALRVRCDTSKDCGDHEICLLSSCMCEDGYQHDYRGSCIQCFKPSDICEPSNREDVCCGDYICDIDNICVRDDGSIDFSTVAKIALAAALVVTMVAVIGVFWRAFIQDRCCPHWRRHRPEEDTMSINSIQRFILQRMQDRPPRYDPQQDKPPTYAECVGDMGTDAENSSPSSDPPPYSIVLEGSQDMAAALPSYRLQESSAHTAHLAATPLNVHCIRLNTDVTVVSPEMNMDDLVVCPQENMLLEDCPLSSPEMAMDDLVLYSETESTTSADSIHYHNLNADDHCHILDSSSTSSEELGVEHGLDNTGYDIENDGSSTQHEEHRRC